MGQGRRLCRLTPPLGLGIGLLHIRQPQQIVGAGAEKLRQLHKDLCGNISASVFIVGVAGLGAAQAAGHIPLGQIPVLPKIPKAVIHKKRSFPRFCPYYSKTICCIVVLKQNVIKILPKTAKTHALPAKNWDASLSFPQRLYLVPSADLAALFGVT